jgi:hypothetical protein
MKVLRLQEKAPPLRLSEGRGFKGRVTFAEGSRVLPHQSNSAARRLVPPARKERPRQSGARIILERKGKMKHADTNSKSRLF